MEILRILIYSKDDSLLPLYPCEEGSIGVDLEIYSRFLFWAVENSGSSGKVPLYESAYDTIIELTQWDDLPCPSSFVIEFALDSQFYALCLSYRRTDFFAKIVKLNDQ